MRVMVTTVHYGTDVGYSVSGSLWGIETALCDNLVLILLPISFFLSPFFSQNMRMSGESLDILQLVNVDRESAGTYACSALNTEGETRSSHLTLRVQCEYQ